LTKTPRASFEKSILRPNLINGSFRCETQALTVNFEMLRARAVWMKKSFRSACRRAGIKNFVFHDLRHCSLNNLRKAGNDFFQIMALSGHKTMSCFKRYNLVTEEELSGI